MKMSKYDSYLKQHKMTICSQYKYTVSAISSWITASVCAAILILQGPINSQVEISQF